jgi:hypothetical protein
VNNLLTCAAQINTTNKGDQMATIEDLRKYQTELKAKFGADTNVAYANISQTQLSVARHYGSANIQGKHYLYNPVDDSLIREDVAKWVAKRKKADKQNLD